VVLKKKRKSKIKDCLVKICGVRDPGIALVAADAGADFVGLVFVAGSPRRVTMDEAHAVVNVLPPFVEPIGLFADAPQQTIRQTALTLGLRTCQLHGHETPVDVRNLAPLRVIKSLVFQDAQTTRPRVEEWRGISNLSAILFDTPPLGAALPGGGGRAFDWKALGLLRDEGTLDGLPPVILAGGLTPSNVVDAMRAVRPWAVDVSSGVESSRGIKDPALVAAFCRAAKALEDQSI
jgi:phosphoribosylanthranilate isomerase